VKKLSEEQTKQITTTGGWAIAACVLLYVLYQYVFMGLYWGPRQKLKSDIIKIQQQMDDGAKMILTGARDSRVWSKMNILDSREDLDARDQAAATVWDVFTRAAQRAGMSFQQFNSSAGAHAINGQPDFEELRFNAVARTTTARLAGFLYAVETNTEVPARIDQLDIHAVTPGEDNLSVTMTITALVYAPKSNAIATRPAGAQGGTRPGVAATMSGRSGTRPVAVAAGTKPAATMDTTAIEKAMEENRKAEQEKIKKTEAEQEAFNNLPEEEKLKVLEKKRLEEAAAASQKAMSAADKEAEMMRKRAAEEQKLGAATTTAPAGGVR
jgi:hypothetical protein